MLLLCGTTSGNKCRSTVTVCEEVTVPCLPYAAVVQTRVMTDAGTEKLHDTHENKTLLWSLVFKVLHITC